MSSLPPFLLDLPRNPAVAIGVPVGLGIFTGSVTRSSKYAPSSAWYKSLQKPAFDPPKWAFGVVWPVLYACMGWSSHLIVKALDHTPPGLGRDRVKGALGLYYLQLALNQIWTPTFFGAGAVGPAFVTVAALTGTIGYLIKELQDIEPKAAYFLYPYLAWSSFATYLNGTIWWKNYGRKQWRSLVNKADDRRP